MLQCSKDPRPTTSYPPSQPSIYPSFTKHYRTKAGNLRPQISEIHNAKFGQPRQYVVRQLCTYFLSFRKPSEFGIGKIRGSGHGLCSTISASIAEWRHDGRRRGAGNHARPRGFNSPVWRISHARAGGIMHSSLGVSVLFRLPWTMPANGSGGQHEGMVDHVVLDR